MIYKAFYYNGHHQLIGTEVFEGINGFDSLSAMEEFVGYLIPEHCPGAVFYEVCAMPQKKGPVL